MPPTLSINTPAKPIHRNNTRVRSDSEDITTGVGPILFPSMPAGTTIENHSEIWAPTACATTLQL